MPVTILSGRTTIIAFMTHDTLSRSKSRIQHGKGKMEIVVNEEPLDCSDGLTIEELLVKLGLSPNIVLVERNSQFVQRGVYSTTVLADGDSLELIQIVGGG